MKKYAAIQVAQREPYCYGGTGPNCFDCSGLVVAAYRYAINLPARGVRTSTQMRNWTRRISLRHAHSGDLLFYSGRGDRLQVEVREDGGDLGDPHGWASGERHPIRKSGLIKVGQVVT